MTKICSKCKNELCTSLFYKSKATKDGLQSTCKSCQKERSKEYLKDYRITHRGTVAIANKNWSSQNKDRIKSRMKDYYLENAEEFKLYRKEHYKNNKAAYLHYSKMRKLRIAKASPPWLTQQMIDDIKNIYLESRKITDQSGILHEVDHIVPLNGESVCGLHVPWNLRIITKDENISKFNSLDQSLALDYKLNTAENINKEIT